jgi:hypothetical protein
VSARAFLCQAGAKVVTTLSLLFLLFYWPAVLRAQNVLTWRYDNTHQGQNTQETILTPTNVNTNTFGKLFSYSVDGNVYAQPLYVSGLTINGATHNVIFIADEHDSVYAFDADTNGGTNSAPLWQASMLSTAHGAASGATTVPSSDVQGGTGDIHPEIGITATPVIDASSQTIFLVAKSKESGNYVQRLHALNILTGAERSGSPVVISASVPGNGNGSSGGTLAFSSLWQNNRPALDLFNGSIYLGFASHGDDGPWHGWVLVYNENTLKQTAAMCTSPNGDGDGIWSSGAGFPIDTVTPNGRAFIVTGNGDMTSYPPLSNNVDFGESILRYDLSNGGFAISDAFTSFNQAALTGSDLDQGSGGILMLPDQAGTYPHELVEAGKEGRILVLNRDGLNGYAGSGAGSNTNAVQDITGAIGGLWSTPAYWNGNVYIWGYGDTMKMFPLTNGKLATQATEQSSVTSGFPGATPVVSSNGTSNGIVWALRTDQYNSNGAAVLYAFNATDVAQEYYNSAQNPTRDSAGGAIKFQVPVVINGKVYVGTNGEVDIYGLLNQEPQAPAPVIAPSGGTYGATQTITITDSVSGAEIYYTTDGSTPSTSSTLYTAGGFKLSTGATVQAIASASGYLQSTVASATYAFTTQTPLPTFSPAPGSYTSAQSVTIADTNTSAAIYYTTDGSTPTTSSTRYTGAIPISSTTILSAIAVASGLTASGVTSGDYVVQIPGTSINFANGFSNVTGLTLNGSATNVDDSRLQLTTGLDNQAGSVFWNTPTNIQSFTTDFTFQLSDAQADGFTFTIQNEGLTALGDIGGGLGYGPNPSGGTAKITNSVAVKFDIFNNAGEGTDSTGLYTDGATPTLPAVDMTSSGVILSSGDTIDAHITYNGTNLVMTLTDIVVNKTFTYTWPINIPATVGGNTAYIGFTGATGGETASQKILTWTFSSTTSASQTPTPTFSPAAGTYTSAQSVSIIDAGATIYYTTNGSTPTTSSAVYSSPIPVSSNTTIQAIAVASGSTQSAVGSATYVIQTSAPSTINFASGFPNATGLQLNGKAKVNAGSLEVTDGGTNEANSVFWTTPVNVQSFTTNFNFALTSAVADGFTFTIQNTGTTAVGQLGGGLGYGINPGNTGSGGGIGKSVAVKFDIYNNSGEGNDSTGIFTDGAAPTTPATSLTSSGITLASGDTIAAQLIYNGTTLTLNLTDTVTGDTFSQAYTINIPSTVGANTAYVGFTGGTGGYTAIQNIKSWTFSSGTTQTAAEPVFNPAPGTYTTAQNVSLTSATTGATIYYTTDGSTPTHSSATYSAPIVVNGTSLTIRAFASASGYQDSPIVVGTYQIQPVTSTVATPTISPATGTTFSSSLSVSMADTTANSTIYYTTNGTTPTTSSTKYTGAFNISASTTVNAIAAASGMNNSSVATATYTLASSGTGINYGSGFGSTAGLTLNGAATNAGSSGLEVTTGSTYQIGSAFYNTPMNIQTFTTDFTFQLTNAHADGFTFTIQNNAPTAIGGGGGGLGYGTDPNPSDGGGPGIGKSVAVKFDIYSNAGEGTDSTGVYLNGAAPTVPATDMTSSGVVLRSGDTMHAHITYDGTNLVLTLTDTVTNAVFTHTFAVNIPSTVGADTAYIGFTGASGGAGAVQKILTWTFTPGSATVAQTPAPTFSVAGGTYSTAQSVALTDAGATIYYTIDGSTPTTGSTVYSTPISVDSGTVTIKAIAQASGQTASSVASATYTIQSSSTPTINFASGFPSAAGLQLNGSTTLNAGSLELTNGGEDQASSVFWTTPVNVQSFTTNFNFALTSATADGFTFTIQNAGTTALGGSGGGLGYGPDPGGGNASIGKSVAVKFDIYNNSGEGNDSTGVYTNGATPTVPATSLTSSGITLASGDTIAAQLVYNGTTLTLNLTDTVTGKTFSQAYTINIPSTVGANTAYVGFTAGTGGSTAIQNIKSWTYTTP